MLGEKVIIFVGGLFLFDKYGSSIFYEFGVMLSVGWELEFLFLEDLGFGEG